MMSMPGTRCLSISGMGFMRKADALTIGLEEQKLIYLPPIASIVSSALANCCR